MGRLHRPSIFQTTSSLKPPGQLLTNFICSLQGLGEKSCSNGLGHMTNMAAMPIVKTLNNFLSKPVDL